MCNCNHSNIKFDIETLNGVRLGVLDLFCPVDNFVYAVNYSTDRIELISLEGCKFITTDKVKVTD